MTRYCTGLAISLALTALPAAAQPDPVAPPGAAAPAAECAALVAPAPRLACYDAAHRRPLGSAAAAGAARPAGPDSEDASAILATLWGLTPARPYGLFKLRPHNGNYLLPLRYTTHPNTRPTSPAPGHSVGSPQPADAVEVKFQLSTKFKVAENLIGDNGDLWFGYTQQSNWQLYNRALSSPFRETSHEPEVIFTWRTGQRVLGWQWELLNLGLVHQSNGRPLPLSRSWNRVYAQFGLTRDNLALLIRPWVRLEERAATDDNPDITDYMGHGDIRLAYTRRGHTVSLLGRLAGSGRGALQLDWIFPLSGSLKGYLQASHGYGESLLDYNHRQTTVGLGIFLLSWE